MNEVFAREAAKWHRETQEFINALPEGKFKKGLTEAGLRNKKRMAEIGYEAYYAEFEAKNQRLLQESAREDIARMQKTLLKKAEEKELTGAEHKRLISAGRETKTEYIRIMQAKSGVGKRFFGKTFESFTADGKNDEALDACVKIANGQRTKGVILSGDTGIGKSHLAAAVINHLTNEGRFACFVEARKLIGRIQDSFRTTGIEKAIKKLLDDNEILVIDDLGTEYAKEGSTWTQDLFYSVIDQADLDEKTIIITTNLSSADIRERYGNRTHSRLIEMCDYIEYSGRDRRFEPTEETTPFDKA